MEWPYTWVRMVSHQRGSSIPLAVWRAARVGSMADRSLQSAWGKHPWPRGRRMPKLPTLEQHDHVGDAHLSGMMWARVWAGWQP